MTTYTVELTKEQIEILIGACCACEDRNHLDLLKENRAYMRDALERANVRLIGARLLLTDTERNKEIAA